MITESEVLVSEVIKYMQLDCMREEKYGKRAESFFDLHDKFNSERVYQAIVDR